MIKLIHSSNKICAMCRHWNGGRGCPSLRPSAGGFFEVDNKDEQQCFKTGFKKPPISGGCHDFVKNY